MFVRLLIFEKYQNYKFAKMTNFFSVLVFVTVSVYYSFLEVTRRLKLSYTSRNLLENLEVTDSCS